MANAFAEVATANKRKSLGDGPAAAAAAGAGKDGRGGRDEEEKDDDGGRGGRGPAGASTASLASLAGGSRGQRKITRPGGKGRPARCAHERGPVHTQYAAIDASFRFPLPHIPHPLPAPAPSLMGCAGSFTRCPSACGGKICSSSAASSPPRTTGTSRPPSPFRPPRFPCLSCAAVCMHACMPACLPACLPVCCLPYTNTTLTSTRVPCVSRCVPRQG